MATIITILRILSIVDYWTCAKGSSAKTRGHAALVIFRLTSSGVSCGRCGCCGHGDLSPNLEMFAKVPNPKTEKFDSRYDVDSSMKTAESGSLFDILACPAFKPILGLSEIHIFNYIHTFIMYVCMVSDVEHCGT